MILNIIRVLFLCLNHAYDCESGNCKFWKVVTVIFSGRKLLPFLNSFIFLCNSLSNILHLSSFLNKKKLPMCTTANKVMHILVFTCYCSIFVLCPPFVTIVEKNNSLIVGQFYPSCNNYWRSNFIALFPKLYVLTYKCILVCVFIRLAD